MLDVSGSNYLELRSKRVKSLWQSREVLVLVSIVVVFVCCSTPAAILGVLYSVKLDGHLAFQVASIFCKTLKKGSNQVFRAIANNLELLNFALNFYIFCLCRYNHGIMSKFWGKFHNNSFFLG